jgi:hypothetical protein
MQKKQEKSSSTFNNPPASQDTMQALSARLHGENEGR